MASYKMAMLQNGHDYKMAMVMKWPCYKMDLVIKWPLTLKLILGLADHRAVYNVQSDDGLVYFTAIGDIVKVQQCTTSYYNV